MSNIITQKKQTVTNILEIKLALLLTTFFPIYKCWTLTKLLLFYKKKCVKTFDSKPKVCTPRMFMLNALSRHTEPENWRHYISGSKYNIHPKFDYISKET